MYLRCPGGIAGNTSVLGVVQFTPYVLRVALVSKVLSKAENAHWN